MRKTLSELTQQELETTARRFWRRYDRALGDANRWPGKGWDDVLHRFAADERRLEAEIARRHLI